MTNSSSIRKCIAIDFGILNCLGLEDWSEADVLTQVLAASQQEYLDSLKHQSPESEYNETLNVEGQYHPQTQPRGANKCKEESNTSNCSSPEACHKNPNYAILSENQYPRPVLDSIVIPVPAMSTISIQNIDEGRTRNQDTIAVKENSQLEKDSEVTNDLDAEQSIANPVPSEASEFPDTVPEECRNMLSSNTTESKDSSVKENKL